LFSGKNFKAKKPFKLHLLALMLFPRKLIEIKFNEVQPIPIGKFEWDFFPNGGSSCQAYLI
jgi:hypothetical protein